MDVSATATNLLSQQNAANQTTSSGFGAINSSDFFQLMITDLLNQNPLEPTDNEKMLQQINSLREMEMNQQMTTSMKSLMEQQRFGSAATLIGKYVESTELTGTSGTYTTGGVVTGVAFNDQGQAILQLDNGTQLPLENIKSVTSIEQLADGLIGKEVTANVLKDGEIQPIAGIVTEIKTIAGRVMLELDSGEIVAFSDLVSVKPAGQSTAA